MTDASVSIIITVKAGEVSETIEKLWRFTEKPDLFAVGLHLQPEVIPRPERERSFFPISIACQHSHLSIEFRLILFFGLNN
ncbi:MAG: hypothetical protein WAZ30_08600, partial [Syntrophorhabdus sp.]